MANPFCPARESLNKTFTREAKCSLASDLQAMLYKYRSGGKGGCDEKVPYAKQVYIFQGIFFITALITFGIWFTGDKSDATLEWVGFILSMIAMSLYAPFFCYSQNPDRKMVDDALLTNYIHATPPTKDLV